MPIVLVFVTISLYFKYIIDLMNDIVHRKA